MGEHPDFKLEGALAPLKDLKFDNNPVVVLWNHKSCIRKKLGIEEGADIVEVVKNLP